MDSDKKLRAVEVRDKLPSRATRLSKLVAAAGGLPVKAYRVGPDISAEIGGLRFDIDRQATTITLIGPEPIHPSEFIPLAKSQGMSEAQATENMNYFKYKRLCGLKLNFANWKEKETAMDLAHMLIALGACMGGVEVVFTAFLKGFNARERPHELLRSPHISWVYNNLGVEISENTLWVELCDALTKAVERHLEDEKNYLKGDPRWESK